MCPMKTAAYRVIEDMPEHQKLVGMKSNSHIQSCKYCKPEMVALAGPEISPIKETYQWLVCSLIAAKYNAILF
jgi:hypothetical protein